MLAQIIEKTRQKPANDRYVSVADGVRLFCVLGVVWYHIWQQSWLSWYPRVMGYYINIDSVVRSGYLFVDILLTLSGFVLFLPYARAHFDSAPLPSVKRFYQNRFLRIVPGYYLCIAVMLFAFALPEGQYESASFLRKDVISHITFTHTLFTDVYIATKLNTPLWTLAVEAQFYLLFPFIARAFRKYPVYAYLAMTASAFLFRFGFAAHKSDTTMLVNQLPAFLDVYANGMACAYAYVFLARKMKPTRLTGWAFALASLACALCVYTLFIAQTGETGYESIRLGQMNRRYLLSLAGALFLLCAGHARDWLRFLLGNRVVRFFAGVTYPLYVWHFVVAIKLKQWRFPPYEAAENPQMAGECAWQWQYSLACVVVSLLLSILITYAFEKPVRRAISRLFTRGSKREEH